MGVIYLKHPVHGGKVACTDMEAAHDRALGWEDFDPNEVVSAPIPAFLSPPGTPLPEGFPGRDLLVAAGLLSMESIAGKSTDELQAIPGVGKATATKILDAQ